MSRAERGEQLAVGEAGSPDLVVVRGGMPTDDELAAIGAAVTAMVAVSAEAGAANPPPAWAQAALREAVGARPACAPCDLDDVEVVPGG